MNVRVRLFALAKQMAGRDSIELQLPDGAVVADLRTALAESVPPLAPLLNAMTFAINAQYAADGDVLTPAAEVACIPPVSGG